jgi:hypothetical protein
VQKLNKVLSFGEVDDNVLNDIGERIERHEESE